jgi:hypothetical protein
MPFTITSFPDQLVVERQFEAAFCQQTVQPNVWPPIWTSQRSSAAARVARR